MKRTLWITMAALAIAAAATMPLMAQPPQGSGQGRGMGMGMGMGPGGPGGRGGPGGPFPMLRELNLTDTQREQIRAIMEEHRGSAPQQKVAELQRTLQAAILADSPDTAAIDQLKSAILAAHAEELADRIALEGKVAQVLTAEQRAQARELLSKEPPDGPGRGRRGGGGFWHH